MSKYQPQKKHAPIDDSVEIPAAIRAAAARSEQLHKAMYEDQPDPSEEPKASEPEKAKAEGGNGTEGQAPQSEQRQAEPKATASQQEEPKAPAPDTQKPATSDAAWEHKYNSLKGRYDQQANTISNLTQRLSDMEAAMSRMHQSNSTREPAPAELTFKPIGPEERETFGEDFIDVAKRAAMEGLGPEVARIKNEIQRLQGHLENITTSTAKQQQQNIYTFLDGKMENWRTLNRSQEFIAWASLPDPFSGVTRIEMMREAFNKGDGPRVLNFFQGFLKDEAATDPARSKPEIPVTQQGKVPLETFAAPGRAKAPAASEVNAPGEKETITRAQIANFYRLKAQGHWRGNPEEEAALERRIFDAERDGRIVE